MRIAYDYQVFVMQPYGGISRYFTRLAQGLLDMEQQVGIFAPLHRNGYLAKLPESVVHGLHLNRYPRRTTRMFRACNRVVARFQMMDWHPELVHETYYWEGATTSCRCPVVVTVHDMIHELFSGEFHADDKIVKLKRLAVERADHVICVSENTKRDLMQFYGTPESKLSVVHHGVDYFLPAVGATPFGTSTGRCFVLYVGLRGGYKNFSRLLKAISSSKRLISEVDVIAFGGGSFTADELGEIAALGFTDGQVIQMSGSDDLLGSLYGAASAFVYPSLYEGFGIPPLEAMAHQCPVICSNTSSMPEVVGLAGEYFDPADTEDMRQAIENVVYSDTRSDQMRVAGLERIQAFSWEKCSQETLDIYRNLIA